jgi:hypothetical protein
MRLTATSTCRSSGERQEQATQTYCDHLDRETLPATPRPTRGAQGRALVGGTPFVAARVILVRPVMFELLTVFRACDLAGPLTLRRRRRGSRGNSPRCCLQQVDKLMQLILSVERDRSYSRVKSSPVVLLDFFQQRGRGVVSMERDVGHHSLDSLRALLRESLAPRELQATSRRARLPRVQAQEGGWCRLQTWAVIYGVERVDNPRSTVLDNRNPRQTK